MRVRRALRISLTVLGCILLVMVAALGTAWGLFRSAWGQRKVTHWVSAQLEKTLRGHVSIGRISIPRWGALQLDDMRIVDLQGEEAVQVQTIRAHWQVGELRRSVLSSLALEGVVVSIHHTVDQRINLQELVDLDAPSTVLRITALSIEGRVKGEPSMPTVFFQLKTALTSTQDLIRFDDTKVYLTTKLEGAVVGPVLAPVFKKVFGIEVPAPSIELALEGHGGAELPSKGDWRVLPTQLQLRVVPDGLLQTSWFTPQGPWTATVDVVGSQSDLTGQVVLDLPIGTAKIVARTQVGPGGRQWHIASDVQWDHFQKWFPLLPGAALHVQMSGDVDPSQTSLTLQQFELKQKDNVMQLTADARKQKQGWDQAHFHMALHWREWALERWVKTAPALEGNVNLSAHFSMDAGSWQGNAKLRANQLRLQGTKLDKFVVSARIRNNLFHVLADIVPTVRKKTAIRFTAKGSPSRWDFETKGVGPTSSAFRVAGRGNLTMAGSTVQKAEVFVRQASMSINKVQLDLLRPFVIRWSTAERKLALSPIRLGYGTQQLTAYGKYQTDNNALQFHVSTEQLDLRAWAPLIPSFGVLPHTSFTLQADVGGTLHRPQASIYFGGKSDASERLGLKQAQYQLNASWGQGQITGNFLVSSPRTRIQSRFSIPTDTEKSLQLALDGKIPLELVRELLPDALREIEGDGTLQVRVGGSLQNPTLAALLRIPAWKFSQLRGRDAVLELTMADRRFAMTGEVTFLDERGASLGTASLRSSAVADWEAWISARSLKQHLWTLDWKTEIFAKLDRLKALIPSNLSKQFPLDQGNLILRADLQGSLASPRIQATLQGAGWTWSGLQHAPLDTQMDLVTQDGMARFSWKTMLKSKPWIQGEGSMPVDLESWLRDLSVVGSVPIKAHVALLPRDLAEVSSWSGVVQSQFDVQGSLRAPRMSLELAGTTLRFGDLLIPRVKLTASSNGKDPFFETAVRFDSPEQQDGDVELSARIPWSFDPAGIQATLRANRFLLKYQTNRPEWFGIRLFRGILDAQFSFAMVAGRPILSGQGALSKGTLETNFDQRSYKNVSVEVLSRPSDDKKSMRLEFSNFLANVEEGTVKGRGSATLQGSTLVDSNFVISTEHLTLLQGALPLHLDATVDIRGRSRGNNTDIEIQVVKGRAVIPKLQAGAGMQSVNTPVQIKFQGKRAEEDKRRRALRDKLLSYFQPAGQTQLRVRIPAGTLRLEGPELSVATEGNITLMAGEKDSSLTGEIRSLVGGDIQLADKHYDLLEAGLSFSGSVSGLDPQINIRIGRPIIGGTLYIRVQGPLSKPRTQIWAEPPGYSQLQLLMLAAGGEVDGPGSNTESGSPNAAGVVSGFLSGQLRKELGSFVPDKLSVSADPGVGLTGLEVGKRLFGNKLSVSYSYAPSGSRIGQGAQNVHQGCIQYAFLRGTQFCQRHPVLCNIQLNGCLGDASLGNFALSWQFPLDYNGKPPQSSPTPSTGSSPAPAKDTP